MNPEEGTESLDVDGNARDFLSASDPKMQPGEVVDREQLAEQLRAWRDSVTDDEVEAVATRIEELAAE